MVEADPVMRAARNAFLVVILLLLGVSTYQFFTIDSITRPIALLWIVAVLAFYGSKHYYRRQDAEAAGGDGAAGGDEAAGGDGAAGE